MPTSSSLRRQTRVPYSRPDRRRHHSLRRRPRRSHSVLAVTAAAAVVAALLVIILPTLPGLPAGQAVAAPAAPPAAGTTRNQGDRKVILFVVDGISLSDLMSADAPNIKRLATNGGLGLMNARVAGRTSPGSCYLSLGASARADAGPNAMFAFDAARPLRGRWGTLLAGEMWRQRVRGTPAATDVAAPTTGVVSIAVAEMWARSEEQPLDIFPGYLGTTLAKAGLTSAVVGNADTIDEPHREAALIAMTEDGRVPVGTVDASLATAADTLGNRRTKPVRLRREVAKALKQADFVVVELGDTARANLHAVKASAGSALIARLQAIQWSDRLIGDISRLVDPSRTLFMVVTPTPETGQLESFDRLTPLVISGPGVDSGVLTSDTTRWDGVVTNMDVAPTVLRFLGVDPPALMTGRPIESRPRDSAPTYLLDLEDKAVTVNFLRDPAMGTIAALALAALGLALVRLIFWPERPLFRAGIPRAALMFVMTLPAALLLQWPLRQGAWPWILALDLVLAVALTAALMRLRPVTAVATLALGTSVLLAVDTLTGSNLQDSSVLGSHVMLGVRFYGMGNTYMGIFVAALAIGLASLLQARDWPRPGSEVALGLAFGAGALIVGAPMFGANWGGLITAVGAGAIGLVTLSGRRLSWKTGVLVAAAAACAIVAFLAVDMLLPGRQSHGARTVESASAGGVGQYVGVITRKLQLNLRSVVRGQTLAEVVIGGTLLLLALLARPGRRLRPIAERYPYLERGVVTVSLSAFIAMAFNDTGVVTAAVMMLYALGPLLYVMVSDQSSAAGSP